VDREPYIPRSWTHDPDQRRAAGPDEDTTQTGVFAAYATAGGSARVDRERYLPTSWTEGRERCRAAEVPDEREFATKGETGPAHGAACPAGRTATDSSRSR
jgi:hypothetical protein